MKQLLIILIILCSLQGFGQIKGYWRLDGNSNDASGNGNNGTDTNITYSQSNGILNGGAGFNGTSFIKVGGDNTFISLTQGTISLWFKTTDATKINVVFGVSPKSTASIFQLFFIYILGDGSINLTMRNVNSDILSASSSAGMASVGKWNHLVFVGGSSGNKIYLNSKQIALTYSAGSASSTYFFDDITMSSAQNYYVGGAKYNSLTENRFGWGGFDEVKLDNTVWSPAKVKNEYSRVKGFYQN